VSQRREFHGALIRVDDGIGCLHPWPEFGDAPVEEQLQVLRNGGTSRVIERALRMAAVDGEARKKSVSLFAGLDVPLCHFSWDQNQPAEAQVRRVIDEGWRAIKTKGWVDLKRTSLLVEQLGGLLGDAPVKMRLDFNSCLTEAAFSEWTGALNRSLRERLDFVEDPFSYDPKGWDDVRSRFGLRLALDKQLRGAVEGFDVAVLKPGRREWRELVGELPSQVKVVMTSAMDHAIGQSFAAYEAALAWKELGDRMDLCGLCTEHLFEKDAFFERLGSAGGKLEVDRNDTGLGFDDVLAKLSWRSL
jgi:O-succinylbenzoate synthase